VRRVNIERIRFDHSVPVADTSRKNLPGAFIQFPRFRGLAHKFAIRHSDEHSLGMSHPALLAFKVSDVSCIITGQLKANMIGKGEPVK
jgi:hypothetical protein